MKLFLSTILGALLLSLVSSPPPAAAQSRAEKKAAERLTRSVETAFTARNLGSLDVRRPYRGKVKIVVENSLEMGDGQYEIKSFRTLKSGERWLRSRETTSDNGFATPFRNLMRLSGCRKGVCTYNSEGGILHNQLYLKRLNYVYQNGRAYIKTIYLLDGN